MKKSFWLISLLVIGLIVIAIIVVREKRNGVSTAQSEPQETSQVEKTTALPCPLIQTVSDINLPATLYQDVNENTTVRVHQCPDSFQVEVSVTTSSSFEKSKDALQKQLSILQAEAYGQSAYLVRDPDKKPFQYSWIHNQVMYEIKKGTADTKPMNDARMNYLQKMADYYLKEYPASETLILPEPEDVFNEMFDPGTISR